MPSSHLPARPNLEQLRKQAKDLLKDYRAGHPPALLRFRESLPRLAHVSDARLKEISLSLRDAQRVIAVEQGFDDWTQLKDHVDELTSSKMIEMDIDRIQMHPVSGQKILVLKQKQADTYLPIWIGPVEADSIALKLEGQQLPRPLTHDLMESMIGDLGARVSKVVVSDIRDHTFFAKVVIQRNGTTIERDSRTSDAIALAVRSDAPIYATSYVLDRAGVTFDPESGLQESPVFDWQSLTIQNVLEDISRMASEEVEKILQRARSEAGRLGRSSVEPRDILLALVRDTKGVSAMVFANLATNLAALLSALERLSEPGESASGTTPELSEASLRVMRLARMEAHLMVHGRVEPEHLLLGLVLADDEETAKVLGGHGIEIEGARVAVIKALNVWRTVPPTSSSQSIG